MEKRNINCSIDIVRALCALLVAVQHVPVFAGEYLYENPIWFFFTSKIARIAVPYFFCVGGVYYFRALDAIGIEATKKQLRKLIKLYLIWSLIYAPYEIYVVSHKSDSIIGLIKNIIINFCVDGFGWQMWYICALILILIIVAIAYRLGAKKIAFALSLLFYISGIYLMVYATPNAFLSSNTFKIFRRFILFGFPLFMSSMCVEKLVYFLKKKKNSEYIVVIFAFILFFVEQGYIEKLGRSTVMSISTYLLVVSIVAFCFIHPFEKYIKTAKFGKCFANLLYFSHVLLFWIIQFIEIKESVFPVAMYLITIGFAAALAFISQNKKFNKVNSILKLLY